MASNFSRNRSNRAGYNPPPPTSRLALAPGTRVGAYEILTLIGAGGMGEVSTLDDRLVAVPIQSSTGSGVLNAGAPVVLFSTHMSLGGVVGIAGALSKAQYAVGRDGRFLMIMNEEDTPLSPINIGVNWTAVLKP